MTTAKIWSYLLLVVFNWNFVVGLTLGYAAKALNGGPVISTVTGMTIGIILHELFKYLFWK